MPNTKSNASAVKIAILGGSAVGTPELVEAIQRHAQYPGDYELTLTLHGRSRDKLDAVARVAAQMAADMPWLRVQATTDAAEALSGAQYVINQVRVGGLAARAFDERYPLPLGIPGEETVGPGGFANATRTVPECVRLAQIVERHAPDALLLSFTNPASVVQYAVMRTTKLRTVGLCDGPVTMTGQAAAALGVLPESLSVDYVGMHHFGFITRVVHDGRDVTDKMLAGLDRVTNLNMDLDLVRALGALPTPYFRYFVHADRILAQQKAATHSRAEQLMALEKELVAEYATAEGRPAGLSKRSAKWYDAIIAPVLMCLIERRTGQYIVNVPNQGALAWLPPEAIIETPALFEAGQIRPVVQTLGAGEIRARIQLNSAYEMLMVEAILEQSEAKALRALCMNPMVGDVSAARAILKIIWPDADPEKSAARAG